MGALTVDPTEFFDYCPSCGDAAVTPWAGEVCGCCGRVWGRGMRADGTAPTCAGRHLQGDVWRRLLDAE
jgi:hypothetical protein